MINKSDGFLEDLFSAVRDDGLTAVVENDSFKQTVIRLAVDLLSGPAAPLIGNVISAALPRINGVFLSYKQHRFERNMKRLVNELSKRVSALESNYQQLNEKTTRFYNDKSVEMLLDSVIDEPQEEKICYSANAFVTLMTNEANENIMCYFFNTLNDLTVLDIDILWIYSRLSDINWDDVRKKYGVDWDYIQMLREKLVRLGLLYRKNDQIRDRNNDEIVGYFLKVESDSKRSKPKGVSFPNSIKKIGHSETYGISNLGISFLSCIGKNDS